MSHRIVLLFALLILCVPALNQTARKTATPATREEHAAWLPESETYFGISQETFRTAGLSKLTTTEYGALLMSMSKWRLKAAEEAKKSVFTYTCGQLPAKDSKIKVMIQANDNAPSEIMSPLRQRIRGMPDVEIVFQPDQADFGMTVLPMEVRTVDNYKTGYAASVVTYTLCQSQFGDSKWPIQIVSNHWVFTAGNNAGQIVDQIVSSVDTADIEAARKFRAAVK
jgi:hypothetical protein